MTHEAIRETYPEVINIVEDDNTFTCYDKDEKVLNVDLSVVPEFSQKQLLSKSKREGEDYQGYQIPFMNDDALALIQVKNAFDLGITSTNIEFSNGTIMPITATDFSEFALWFATKRNSFFM